MSIPPHMPAPVSGSVSDALASTPAAPAVTPAPGPATGDAPPPYELDPDVAWSRDPEAYDWYPVLRKHRRDGWTPQAQRKFVEQLADTGSVMQAAMAVGQSRASAYKLRRAPGAEGFAAAWAAAIDNASARALDECFERAMVGSDEPVFDRDGHRIGRRYRQSDKLLMFLLRAYMPDRFRHASRDVRDPSEAPPPVIEPMSRALALLDPPMPAPPHTLFEAEQLDIRLQCAHIMEGVIPERHRAEPAPLPVAMPLGEAFERELEDAKHESSGLPPLDDDEWAAHRAMLLLRETPRLDPEIPGHY